MEAAIHPLNTILHKRDGLALSTAEIDAFIASVVERPGSEPVSDAQIAAFLMAVLLRGLNADELTSLTLAMRDSGEIFDPATIVSDSKPFCIDKHSTGGVGDKTSLLLAPICAAAGLYVPMISGRSLGHTGGTLDKLETIAGYRSDLPLTEFGRVLSECGASMIGQTKDLVPADRILYALRDHTGTVESPYLLCSSIMSKKLAEGLDALVLDVKTGSGAFLVNDEACRALAQLLVDTGNQAGTRTIALLTAMDEPLGRFSGNWLEVWECVDILQGRRHAMSADLLELTLALAGEMLCLGGKAASPDEGSALADRLLTDGSAYRSFVQMVKLQGGDPGCFEAPATVHRPAISSIFKAERDGFLGPMDCKQVGWAIQRLGAGRAKPGDPVSAHAGLEVHAKIGNALKAGDAIFTLHADSEAKLREAEDMLRGALSIVDHAHQGRPLVQQRIG